MDMMAIFLIAFALAQAADIFTTLRGLGPGFREGNPLIAFAMEHLGTFGWVACKLAVAWGAAWYFWAQGLWWPIAGIAAITGGVAWRNHRITRG